MECSILPDDRGVLKDTQTPSPEFELPGESANALARSNAARSHGAMDFFWTALAPFTFLVVCGLSLLALVLNVYLLDAGLPDVLVVSGSVLGAGLVILLPLEYHLVRVRILRPMERFEFELLGKLPWRPDGDVLFSSLRRSMGDVRRALHSMDGDLQLERERSHDLRAQLHERAAADAFADRVAEGLRGAESMEQYSVEAAGLVNSIWPADDLLLLHREEGRDELSILAWVHAGVPVALDRSEVELPGYRWTSLPVPVKEALRRGFYCEAGLPFSQDSAFPRAKSFVAMALEHRGGSAGVILACTAHADPPSAEPLRRSRPLFSVGFGRAMYARELSEAVIRDAMTGAFTYAHFLTIVRHEVARATRYTRFVACALIDVDGLRRVNGEHGFAVGDRVITEVAQVVGGAIRSSDILARVSGGRLALLLPETNEEGAEVVAERVRRRVQEYPFIVARGLVERITVSVGVAVHPPLGVTAVALVDAAERSLTEAKRGGRNRVVVVGGEESPVADLESRQTA